MIILDTETYSDVNLPKKGVAKYVASPNFRIVCICAYNTITKDWFVGTGNDSAEPFWEWCNGESGSLPIAALNSNFDRSVLEAVTQQGTNRVWIDIACLGDYLSLPRHLGSLAESFGVGNKDELGRELVVQMNGLSVEESYTFQNLNIDRIIEYCKSDVEITAKLAQQYQRYTPVIELRTQAVTHEMNRLGLPVDLELCKRIVAIQEVMKEYTDEWFKDNLEDYNITSPTQVARIKSYLLEVEGINTDTLNKAFVDKLLDGTEISLRTRTLLEIRKQSGGANVKKSKYALDNHVDGVLQSQFQYHGTITGRWSGRGFQPQNIASVPSASPKMIKYLKETPARQVMVEHGTEIEDILKSCIRPIIKPKEGTLFIGDFSGIEARTMCWLADDTENMNLYKMGIDRYKHLASVIFNKEIDDVTPHERKLGKITFLSGIYGITSRGLNQQHPDLDASLCERLIAGFHRANYKVFEFQKRLNHLFHGVVTNPPTQEHSLEVLTIKRSENWTRIGMPSGRNLFYRNAKADRNGDIKYDSRFGKSETVRPNTLLSHVNQGLARDYLCESMWRLHAAGFKILMTVHDEVVAYDSGKSLQEFQDIAQISPDWCRDLSIPFEVAESGHYIKL